MNSMFMENEVMFFEYVRGLLHSDITSSDVEFIKRFSLILVAGFFLALLGFWIRGVRGALIALAVVVLLFLFRNQVLDLISNWPF